MHVLACGFPACCVVALIVSCLPPTSAVAQRPSAERPRADARCRGPQVRVVTAERARRGGDRVRWVERRAGEPLVWSPPDEGATRDVRLWFFAVTPWGYASWSVAGAYDGPRMRDGYGRGYDAMGYRYGLQQEYFEQRYNPHYGIGLANLGAPTLTRASDIATPGRQLNLRDMNRRAERLLTGHARAYELGRRALRRGDYARATIRFTLAARLNQSDPAARVMLALARLGQGHFDAAAAAFRRAVELQPNLVYLDLPLAERYPRPGVLAERTRALAAWIRGTKRSDADALFLLGYLRFRAGQFAEAQAALEQAAALRPDDRLVRDLLAIARPADVHDRPSGSPTNPISPLRSGDAHRRQIRTP